MWWLLVAVVTAAMLQRSRSFRLDGPGVSVPAAGLNISRVSDSHDMVIGRDARTPAAIPLKGWWRIAKRTAQRFSENDLMAEAASVTFFALLSVFPALTAIVSIYGLFTNPSSIEDHLKFADGLIPSGGIDIFTSRSRGCRKVPQAA